ncbi:MAG: hypothetical protein QM736_17985 [Vicinamibacterales bacterium]
MARRDAGAQASAALDKIRQAQQRLQRNQNGRGERDVQDAERQAEALSDEQKQIASEVQGMEGMSGATKDAKAQSLQARKDAMDQKLGQLQDQLEKLANDARGNAKDAARKLDEAAGSITGQADAREGPLHEEHAARTTERVPRRRWRPTFSRTSIS